MNKEGEKERSAHIYTDTLKIGNFGMYKLNLKTGRKGSTICIPVPYQTKSLNINYTRNDQVRIPDVLLEVACLTIITE